ncbi:hypothetical protein THARTR1_01166 [Trichoderma harzianum]|uniref:C2H2-type domain-containing protein n=1 Tax=Trichoderma harzianum TaxID=5544 RepID=A0A2K0UMB6_TRIHA|nr:hypothetical protein THARTR1_01166 [Trichoderma harzianum]
MPLEPNWEELLRPVWEFNMRNQDGALHKVDFPNNFNEQPTIPNGQSEWDLFHNTLLEPTVVDEQHQVAAFNTALKTPSDTTFLPSPSPTLSPSNSPADAASDAITNPISATNTNTTNTHIPPINHSRRPGFPCPECGLWFPKRSALNTHLRSSRAHPHEDVKCRCGKSFEKYGLKQHLKQQVKRCKESRADFHCHCGYVVAADAEKEILDHAYACTLRRNRRAGQ